jgi:NTE family protein
VNTGFSFFRKFACSIYVPDTDILGMRVWALTIVIVLVLSIYIATHATNGSQPERFSIDKDYVIQDVRGLAFSGAGTLGYALVGALGEMIDVGLDLRKVKYFAGTSAGAGIATFLACGINFKDIRKFTTNMDLQTLQRPRGAPSWMDGDQMRSMNREFLHEMTGVPDITFQEIYDMYGNTLIITTVNVKNMREPVYLSHHTHPHLSVATAMQASCSIPVYFEPVRIDDMILIDGGALDMFPIKKLQEYIPLSQISGCYLEDDIKYYPSDWKKVLYLTGFSTKMVRRRFSRNRLSKAERQRVIPVSLHDRNYSAVDFNMSSDVKKDIYDIGANSARNFLHGSEFYV